MRHRLGATGLIAALAVVGCGSEGGDTVEPVEYYSGSASAALGASGNAAVCATCHSDDGSRRSGGSFKDIAYRASFKGGDAPNLLAGSNACVTGWMGGTALASGSSEWSALEGYLQSISSPSVTTPNPLAPEVLADEAAYELAYVAGDRGAGGAKYRAACGACHSSGLQLGPVRAPDEAFLRGRSIGRIAQKVRTSGPPPSGSADTIDSTPGPMPFFEPADLSAQDLKDIIAHLKGS